MSTVFKQKCTSYILTAYFITKNKKSLSCIPVYNMMMMTVSKKVLFNMSAFTVCSKNISYVLLYMDA